MNNPDPDNDYYSHRQYPVGILLRNIAYLLVLLSLFIANLWQPTVNAQSYTDRISFDHLTDKEGLTQRTVERILQDSEGNMWFGTHDGLNRYNGYKITVCRSEENNPNSLSYNQISDLLEDNNNNLAG